MGGGIIDLNWGNFPYKYRPKFRGKLEFGWQFKQFWENNYALKTQIYAANLDNLVSKGKSIQPLKGSTIENELSFLKDNGQWTVFMVGVDSNWKAASPHLTYLVLQPASTLHQQH